MLNETSKMIGEEFPRNLFRHQLLIMLHRGLLIRKRHWLVTTFEIMIPFMVILLATEITRTSNDLQTPIAADSDESPEDELPEPDELAELDFGRTDVMDDVETTPDPSIRNTTYVTSYFENLKMRNWKRSFRGQKVYYYADNKTIENVEQLIKMITSKYDGHDPVTFVRKETEMPLIDFFTHQVENNRTSRPTGLITFKDASGISSKNGSLVYHITFLLVSDNFQPIDIKWSPSTDNSLRYLTHQLPILQIMINSAYLDLRKKFITSPSPSLSFLQFIIEALPEVSTLGLSFSTPKKMLLVINIILLINFSIIVYRIQKEKASRLKETFTLSGLQPSVYWLSILINNSIFLFIPLLLINIILTMISPYRLSSSTFLSNASFIPLFIIFNIHAVHLVLWAMLVSIPINRPVLSTALSMVIYSLPIMTSGYEEKADQSKLFFYTLPNGGLLTIYDCIIRESSLTLDDLFRLMDPIDDDRYAIGFICIYMIASSFILYLSVWYLDHTWPFQPGVPKSLFFCISETYLFPGAIKTPLRPMLVNPVIFSEPVSPEAPVAIGLRNVTKQFTNSLTGYTFTAVNDVSLDIHHGMITCLLGHNGAGKTTLMNMITGMYLPTDGQIFVNDHDLVNDTEAARRGMSLCPQYNAFDERFTIEENLFIFAGIKGVPWLEIQNEVEATIAQLSLDDHLSIPAKYLSGGLKRRLCVAMALIGESKILILDEPTSGLDIDARHELWVELKALRHKRTILMTTHDMEEADALADRVIIMDAGTIICAGSTMFLRKALCNGYILRICKTNSFDRLAFLSILRQYLPSASIRDDIGVDITYNLNQFSSQVKPLSELFAYLESNLASLGIESFGVSASSLEEVFFKIGDQNIANFMMARSQGFESNKPDQHMKALIESGVYQYRLSGSALIRKQISSLLLKRFNVICRQWLPFLMSVMFSICVYTLIRWTRDIVLRTPSFRGPIDLSVNPYDRARVIISSNITKYDRPLHQTLTKLTSSRRFANVPFRTADDLTETIREETLQNEDAPFIFGFHLEPSGQWFIWVNMMARRSLALALDIAFNAIIRNQTQESRIDTSYGVITPLDIEKYKEILNASSLIHIESFDIILAFAFFTSIFIVYQIQERVSKAKLLQIMTGISAIVFHLSNLLFDLFLYITFSVTIIALSYAFVRKDFIGYTVETFVTLSLSGLSCLSVIYLFSLLFQSSLSGYSSTVAFQLISTLISGIFVSITDYIDSTRLTMSPILGLINSAFHLNPFYTLMNGLSKIVVNSERNNICQSITDKEKSLCSRQFTSVSSKLQLKQATVNRNCCPDVCIRLPGSDEITICAEKFTAFNYSDGLWINWLLMITQFLVIFFILIQYERGYDSFFNSLLDRIFGNSDVPKSFCDVDVTAEEEYVHSLPHDDTQPLVTLDLYKSYDWMRKFYAVKGISFHIQAKECFGFFGVNGAGKSTTFGMITGDLKPTSGQVWHGPYEISQDRLKCQRRIGYCPQYNPIIDELTGREMIMLFASLRGVPDDSTFILTQEMINLTGLKEYADKSCGNYSSGNKRRLSIALAVIGNPEVVLLDEPTAGVDPLGRRVIWTTLMQIKQQYNCSILLTSHSMEECEAICSKITIMVKGELVCIGSPQHLKQRFGQGYTLQVRMNREKYHDVDYVTAFTEALVQQFQKVRVIDRCETNITFKVDKEAGTWSSLFAKMDSLKETFNLQDYQLTDTTLEQIFSKLHKLK